MCKISDKSTHTKIIEDKIKHNCFDLSENNIEEPKKANYAAVAKQEMSTSQHIKIPDGWVRLTRNNEGKTSFQYGAPIHNSTLKFFEKRDIEIKLQEIEKRHAKYSKEDEETFYTQYKYSWESDEEENEEFSESEDDHSVSEAYDSENDDGDY